MKYGVLNHNYLPNTFFRDSEKTIINLGDYFQSYGIECGYLESGIQKEDIVLFEKYSGFSYSGDSIMVSLNNVYSGSGIQGPLKFFPLPSSVIPLFIGFNCHDEDLLKENIDYFRKWGPIGCRDEKTKEFILNISRDNGGGIKAYISGCSSILLPKREVEDTQDTIFFVDTPESLNDYIPLEYKKMLSLSLKIFQ